MKFEIKFVSSIWKCKAKSRRLENVALKKRMEEIIESRDGLRQKVHKRDEEIKNHEIAIKNLEKELAEIKKNSKS
jgi:hypothetical protein